MMDVIAAMERDASLDMDLMARMRTLEGALGLQRWSLSRSRRDIGAALKEIPRQYPDIHSDWFVLKDTKFADAVLKGALSVLKKETGEATAEEVAQNMAAGLSVSGNEKQDVYGYLGKKKANEITSGRATPKNLQTTLYGYAKDRALDVARKEQRHKKRREEMAPVLVDTGTQPGQVPADVVLDRSPGDVMMSLLSTPAARKFKRWVYDTIRNVASPIQLAVMEAWLDNPDSSNAALGKAKQVVDLKGNPISGQMAGRHRDSVVKKVQSEMRDNPKILDWMDRYLDLAQLGYGGGSIRAARVAARKEAILNIEARYRIRCLLAALKSKKLLFRDLEQVAKQVGASHLRGVSRNGLNQKGISDETYGRKSMIYISWGSKDARTAGEALLDGLGYNVQWSYWPGSGTSEIQVSYFKGHHWDE